MDADARTQTQAPDGARTLNIRACSAWVEKSSRRVLRLDERTRTFEVYYIWCRCQYYISSQSKVSCMYYKQSIDILLTTGMYSIHIICTHVLITRSLYTLYAIAGLSRDSYRGGEDLGYSPPNPFSIDIIWHFPGGTCPQTLLGVESPPKPKILYESLDCLLFIPAM